MLKNINSKEKLKDNAVKINSNALFNIRKSETIGLILSCNSNIFTNSNGRSIFETTLEQLSLVKELSNIIILLDNVYVERCSGIIRRMRITNIKKIIVKEPNINELFRNALLYAKECDIIMLHDCSKSFVDTAIVNELIRKTKASGYAISVVKKSDVFMAATPQVFAYSTLNGIITNKKLSEKNLFDMSEFFDLNKEYNESNSKDNNIIIRSDLELEHSEDF
ncbi:MAG: hypothetical protein M1385_00490 [Candidatus Marsarchaeota archaeon]|nr:hypothetical protein [Candidatus Marsarchaeota archaeon]